MCRLCGVLMIKKKRASIPHVVSSLSVTNTGVVLFTAHYAKFICCICHLYISLPCCVNLDLENLTLYRGYKFMVATEYLFKKIKMALSRYLNCRFLHPKSNHIQQVRSYTYIKKRLVSIEECMRMSRTSGAEYPSIMKRLNLQENWPSFKNTTSEVQLLQNLTNELEYKYIRPGNSHPNYYRIELFMQRLNHLSTMGMTPKDKLKLLKRKPPVLVLCQHEIFDSSGMMYLRGVMKEGPEINYIFYPAFPRTGL